MGSNDVGLIKRPWMPWTPEEDELLRNHVQLHGVRKWMLISKSIPGRCRQSCRTRWCHQLSHEMKRKPFSPEEDGIIMHAQARFGNKWIKIAKLLNGRTNSSVKNRWNKTLKRKPMVLSVSGRDEERPRGSDSGQVTKNMSSSDSVDVNGLKPEMDPHIDLTLSLRGWY